MITPDTSVVIAAFSPWHTLHDAARDALGATEPRRLIGHVALETVSTLSRLPEGHRVSATDALSAVTATFREPWLSLDGAQLAATLDRAVRLGVRGGPLYDALIAGTAQAHGATLLSADRRALPTYEAIGIDAILIS